MQHRSRVPRGGGSLLWAQGGGRVAAAAAAGGRRTMRCCDSSGVLLQVGAGDEGPSTQSEVIRAINAEDSLCYLQVGAGDEGRAGPRAERVAVVEQHRVLRRPELTLPDQPALPALPDPHPAPHQSESATAGVGSQAGGVRAARSAPPAPPRRARPWCRSPAPQ